MNIIERIVNWIRAGYPEGIPPTDYPPLFALLQPVLDETELTDVLMGLSAARNPEHPITRDQVKEAIKEVTQEHPTQNEIDLVATRLRTQGWPLDDIQRHGQ